MAASDRNPSSDKPAPGSVACLSAPALRERLAEEINRAGRLETALSCLLVTIGNLDELTREHLLSVATHLQGVQLPALLPGITVNIGPSDYNPFKQMRLQRFDGHKWVLLPDMFGE